MMMKRHTLVLVLLCCCALSTVTSSAAPSVKEIAAKHLEAIGGVEANKELTTRRVEGTLTVAAIGTPWKMTVIQKAPDKKLTRIEIPGAGLVTEGCDGKIAWKKEPGKEVRRLEGQELTQKLQDARFYGMIDLMTQADLSYKKQGKVGGKMSHVLTASFDDNIPRGKITLEVAIDETTYLMNMIKIPVTMGPKPRDVAVKMDDYREIDGVQIPCAMTVSFDGEQVVSMQFDKITHGIKVDDAIFSMPVAGIEASSKDARKFTEGTTIVHVKTLIDRFDANGNLTIEENELEDGFLKILDRFDESNAILLKLFDKDGDGALTKKEAFEARNFVFSAIGILEHDRDGNWKIGDKESDLAWDQLCDAYEAHNEQLLRKFDRDRNGTLNAQEAKRAK